MENNRMTLRLFGHDIPIVTEAIFLGVIFDQRMTFEGQFRKLTSRAHKRLNLIRRIASLSKKPNPNILAQLYKSIIVPIFEYSSICTINAAEVHINKLKLLQNTALRVITNSPAYIHLNDPHDCTGFSPINKAVTRPTVVNFVEFCWVYLNLLEFTVFEKRVTDGPMNPRTDPQTHGRTKPLIELLFATKNHLNSDSTPWDKTLPF